MTPPRVLVVGGLDPTGRAGLARDVATLESERVQGAVAASCLTVQDSRGVRRVEPVDAKLFSESLDAATTDQPVDAVKVGLLPDATRIEAFLRVAKEWDCPIVLDPVVRAGPGGRLTTEDTLAALRRLLPHVDLVTPNLAEAEALSGIPLLRRAARADVGHALSKLGATAALIKGGHGRDDPGVDVLVANAVHEIPFARLDLTHPMAGRGKGCELATRIAALLAKGLSVEHAVPPALARLRARLEWESRRLAAAGPVDEALRRWEAAFEALLAELRPECVPEVGSNLAYARKGARSTEDVLGLAGRVTIAGAGIGVTGRPRPGGPHHTARIAHTAQRILGHDIWVFNHRHDRTFLDRLGPDHVALSRAEEPVRVDSTMEWMTKTAIDRLRRLPAYLSDLGMPGKEAMIRILAPTPELLLERHGRLHDGHSASRGPRVGLATAESA